MTDDREYRILIVDDQRDVARVLRASLELLDHGYVITDVPSAEEATLELSSRPFDMIITDYHLPGMTGTEFLARVRKRTPDIKAAIITGHAEAEVSKKLGDIEVIGIFEKPIDMEAFTKAVVTALHGDLLPARKPEKISAATEKGAVPAFDERPMALLLGSLQADLHAVSVALVSRSGKVLLKQGNTPEDLRFSELAVLLAYSFSTISEISTYLGDGASGAMHHYEGASHDIFTLSVGLHFFVTIVFPGGSQRQMGSVLRYGKATTAKMVETLGDAAYATDGKPGEKPPEEKAGAAMPEPAGEPPVEAISEPAAVADQAGAVEQPEDQIDLDTLFAAETDEEVEVMEIDLSELDLALEGMGDADSFWESADLGAGDDDEDTMSLDEAMELGLMSDPDETG